MRAHTRWHQIGKGSGRDQVPLEHSLGHVAAANSSGLVGQSGPLCARSPHHRRRLCLDYALVPPERHSLDAIEDWGILLTVLADQ